METAELLWEHDFGITAVDTQYVRDKMDASHLLVDAGRAAFIDTGSTHSVANLLAALEYKGLSVADVDYVFLTHIHLDHAGGAGALMQELPNATCVIHPRGAGHMIAPEKLIAATKAVYGDALYAQLYGDIIAIDKDRVLIAEDGDIVTLGKRTLELIHTPGHALHHYCIVDRQYKGIFTGDTFGVSYRETDTDNGPFVFPTTTPTQFDPHAAHASYDRIVAYQPDYVYLTHYSQITGVEQVAGDLHRRLDEFVAIAMRNAPDADRLAQIFMQLRTYIFAELDDHGYSGDEAARARVVDADLQLNAQGLHVWLQRLEKTGKI